MKTLRFIVMAFALIVLGAGFSACEKDELLTVENTAGNLESVEDKMKNVSTLKISGPLNGDDIFYLREILTSKSCKVSTLDLSDASIVDGGIAYLGDILMDGSGDKYTSKDEIGDFMFCSCKFKTIILPKGVTSIGEGAFESCTNLKDITIPGGVILIGWGAFYGCTSLKEITIPSSVTSIWGGAFYGCTSLTEITLPDGLVEMGEYAFYKCASLYTFVIGSGVTTIGNRAFDGCDRLYEFYCYAVTPPSVGSETFTRGNTFLYVPKGSLEAYEMAWGNYFTNISEME